MKKAYLLLLLAFGFSVNAQQASLDFDGSNDYVSFANPTGFPTGSSAYTLEAWVYPDTMGDKGIAGWGNYGTTNGTNAFRLLPNGIRHYWWSNDLDATTGSLAGAWHHIAATCSATERKIYLDGVLVASQAITVSQHTVPAPTNFTIGKTNGNEIFDGRIDNVRIWTVARTQAEIQAGMSATYGSGTPGLAASYNFNEGSGTTLTDAINPAANNGTLQNFALSGTTSNWVGPAPVTWYVKQGGSGNGTSWANASGDLQATINASTSGDEIWVAAGTYQPVAGQPFAMKTNVKIYGGFATTGAPVFADRNFSANTTILMGNGNRVMNNEGQNLTNTAVLDGFTITNGASAGHGAGIRNVNSYPSIVNCIFTNNASNDWGGGLFNEGAGSTHIYNCLFYNNSAGGGGGAFDNSTYTKYVNCTFSANHSQQNGGGVHTHTSSIVTMDNCIVWGNTANAGGSQIFSSANCVLSFNYSLTDNSAAGVSGPFSADHCIYTDPIFVNSAGYNFKLKLSSPAINSGSTILNPDTAVDLSGLQRVYGASIDMGVYEHQSVPPQASAQIFCGPTTVASLVGTGTDLKWYTALTGGTALASTDVVVASGTYYVSQTVNEYESSRTAVSITVKTIPAAPTAAASQSFHEGETIASISVTGTNLQWYSELTGGTTLDVNHILTNGVTYYVSQTINGCESPRTAVAIITYQAIKYVKPIATGSGDGTSWANASSNLQGMIDSPGTEQVWVAAGTYKPTIIVGTGTNDRHKSFLMKANVKIYGGFAGNETAISQRNWTVNETILSGDLGMQNNDADNVYNVVTYFGNAGTAVLNGFTITKGNANGGTWVYINDVQIFKGYTSAILNWESSPAYSNLKVTDNKGGQYAVYSRYSLSVYDNVNISNNTPTEGALYCVSNQSILRNVTISGNTGIGITCGSATPDFKNVTVSGNTKGIYCSNITSSAFKNVVVSGNAGDAVYLFQCSGYGHVFDNVTISGNAGYSIYNNNSQTSSITIRNSIIHGNQSDVVSPKVMYNSLVQGVNESSSQNGNVHGNTDPLFEYEPLYTTAPFIDGDYNLRPCSTLVNWGENGYVQNNDTDIAGNTRIFGTKVDFGAYELQEAQLPVITSQPSAPYTQQLAAGSTISNLQATGDNLQWYQTATGGQPLSPQTVLAAGAYYVSQTLNGCEGFRSQVNVTITYPQIVYVKPVATGSGAGTSWENATADLQGMISAAGVQEVWVAAGTYKPTVKAGNGNTEQHKAFVMKSNVKIYGGFVGTETAVAQRNIAMNTSRLSGDLGIAGNTSDNAYHVVICSGYLGTATLDGFTISHGYARYPAPAFTHTVNGNTIDQYGGGIYCTGSAPLLNNITVSDNTGDDGTALYAANYSTLIMTKFTVSNNTGSQNINGVVSVSSSTLFLTDAILSGNNRTALYSYSSTCKLANTAITGNLLDGIYISSGSIELKNVTISGNGNYGMRNNGSGSMYNTLVYGNKFGITGNNNMVNSLVQGISATGNNFNGLTDPLFIYAPAYATAPFTTGNYRLQSCSPVLNAGNNGYAPNVSTDADGLPRIFSDTVDLGAYECQFTAHPVPPAPAAEPQNFDGGVTIGGLAAAGTGLKWYATAIGGAVLDENSPAVSGTYYVSQTVDGCESPRTGVSITAIYPPVRYVKAVASGLGDGSSWANASANLQAMINAPDVQQVWVAGGQYQPQGGAFFSMKAGVKIYGGFPDSGNPGMASRNISTYKTILNGNGNSVISNSGNGLTNTALLDGFIIQGGSGSNGAGINNVNSYPTINNCIFRNNIANNFGGGLYNSGNGTTRVTNCLFHNNQAGTGGAVYEALNAHTVYTNSTLADNLAITNGGAIYTVSNAYIQFYNCIVYNNLAYGVGTQAMVGYPSTAISYNSMVMGGSNAVYNSFPANNAITGTPIFADPANGDYALQAISPGIDAGNTTYFADAAGGTDLSGSARLFGGSIDVGAYEYKPECAVTTQWNGTAWSNGSPISYEYSAVIAGNFDSSEDGNITACSLNVTGGDVVIAEGNNFRIKGAITVDDANATFTVAHNANLIQEDDVDNTGEITVIKESAPMYRLDYALWGSPVAGQKLKEFSPQTLDNRFYTYNPVTDGYNVVQNPAATDFEEGKGYLIRVANNHTPFVSNDIAPTPWTGTFYGVPNNGNVNLSVIPGSAPTAENEDGVEGFNAISNPYPSAINIKDFFDANQNNLSSDSPIYFWRKKNEAGTSSYCSLTLAGYNQNAGNAFGDSSNGLFDDPDNSEDWVINPGQGFIVKATSNTVSFNNSMRVAVNNGQMFRTAQEVSESSRLWLNITTTDGGFGQTMIAYTPTTTLGLDYGWDGQALTDGNIAIYSLAGESKLGIQARPAFDPANEVRMEYKVTTAGQYTIALDHFDGVFAEGQPIYLRDNILGVTHNLASPYLFTSEAGTSAGRFDVVYADALGIDKPDFDANSIIVYKEGNIINISTGTTDMKAVAIYDIRGRLLYSANNINAAETAITTLQAQEEMLIVEIATIEGVKAVKKIIF